MTRFDDRHPSEHRYGRGMVFPPSYSQDQSEDPDADLRDRWFEEHDPRCTGDCGPCGGMGDVGGHRCLTCQGSGECQGCIAPSPVEPLDREQNE